MKIGILQTGHVPDEAIRDGHGTYADMLMAGLAGHGFTFTTYELLDGNFPDQITEQDGWIITGSRHGVYEDHAFIPPLESLIRDIHAAQIPLIGICFGHQIIAQAPAVVSRNAMAVGALDVRSMIGMAQMWR